MDAYRNSPTLFRMVPSPTSYGLPFPKIGGVQLSYPLLSQDQVKLRTSNFVGTFIGSTGTKAHENIGNSGRGRSQGVPKIFRAPICRAHFAVIFAIAQLSCYLTPLSATVSEATSSTDRRGDSACKWQYAPRALNNDVDCFHSNVLSSREIKAPVPMMRKTD